MKIVKNIFKGIGIFFTSLITLIVITLILLVLFRGAMYDDFYKNGKCMIVSAGLGEHTVPLRIHNPRELIFIEMKP